MPITPFRVKVNQHGNSPSSMRDGTGERLNYTFQLMTDARLDRLVQGMMARLPRSDVANGYQAPPDALNLIGGDRQIPRGPTESDASYAVRVQQAADMWQIWGSPRALLAQLCAYFSPLPVTCRCVTDSGHWYTMSTPGYVYTVLPPTARPPAVASNWSWDGNTRWWRAWTIVHLPVGYALAAKVQASTWDGTGIWDKFGIWDGISSQALADLLAIMVQWYPEHSLPGGNPAGLIVTSLQPTDLIPGQSVHPFDPTSANTTNADGSTNLPVSNWGTSTYTSGPNAGKPSRPSWATFYNIVNS